MSVALCLAPACTHSVATRTPTSLPLPLPDPTPPTAPVSETATCFPNHLAVEWGSATICFPALRVDANAVVEEDFWAGGSVAEHVLSTVAPIGPLPPGFRVARAISEARSTDDYTDGYRLLYYTDGRVAVRAAVGGDIERSSLS